MLLKACRIATETGEQLVDILIEAGKIKAIGANLDSSDSEVMNLNGAWVLPGIIDPHTHLREPGYEEKEDFHSGTRAAARGGVTTLLDMPNTLPLVTSRAALEAKKQQLRDRAYVDYGFYFGGAKQDNSADIAAVKNSVAATKIFLNQSTGDMLVNDRAVLAAIFAQSKLVAVHAEGEMVDVAIELAQATQTPLYLCHLSTARELESLRRAKQLGLSVYGEVTPHHLFLNESHRDANAEQQQRLRMKPELKSAADNQALIAALCDGTIDTIGTDHAPHLLSEKARQPTFGIPGIEHSLALMLNLVHAGVLTLHQLTQLMSRNAAHIFNLEHKGELAVGFDADLIVVDLTQRGEISDAEVVSKCGWTPWQGWQRGGAVTLTMLRGEVVYQNGHWSEPCLGQEVQFGQNLGAVGVRSGN